MMRPARTAAERLERIGAGLVRWSLVFLLVLFGALKWTAFEAQAVRPLITHSPFLRWVDAAFGQQGASIFVGVIELTTALLIAVGTRAPKAGLIGGLMGMGMFLTTLSFIVTTPNIGGGAAFLVKDVALLGAAMWIAGQAWVALDRQRS